jgi:diguanylate cyclase
VAERLGRRHAGREHEEALELFTAELGPDSQHLVSCDETFGHAAGDDVLRRVAETVSQGVALPGIVARYGGEEFSVLLPHTDFEEAEGLAETLRTAVERIELIHGEEPIRVTTSVGVAELEPGLGAAELLRQAQACLAEAKRTGRNRVVGTIETTLPP